MGSEEVSHRLSTSREYRDAPTENVSGVVGVEEADNVNAEVALEPNDVRSGAVEDL